MTVYELIQELSQYKADTEVRFHVKAKFDTDVEAKFDRNDENDVQEITVEVEFDEDVEFDYVQDHEGYLYGKPYIQIDLEY